MEKKIVSGIMLVLLIVSMLTLALNIQPGKAVFVGGIRILADGSVDPSSAPILNVGNVSYKLTDNINGSISVERDNIVVDGAGYMVQGAGGGSGDGIYLTGSNVTIRNMEIRGFWVGIGIRLAKSHNNTITESNITGNDYGIGGGSGLDAYSYNYTISRNNISNNKYSGISLYHAENTIVWGNTIANNGKYGVDLVGMGQASNNIFYHNNFINNTKHVDTWEEAVWDDGYPLGGNYWSNYTGVDANNDGIGDMPHDVGTWGYDNVDRYPLMSPWTPAWVPPENATPPPQVQVGCKAGDWIKIDYTISGEPSGTSLPQWLKLEFLSVEGISASVRVTMHMSDGTEQSQTLTVEGAAGGQAFGLSGFLVPASSKTGDSVYMSGYGSVTIAGETTRTYAGASRTVVYATISQFGNEFTYYWDKQTGVMVEATVISGGITATGKATGTNMWAAVSSPFWMQWWFYAIVAVVIVALGGTIFFLKKRKPLTPMAPLPAEST